MLRHDLARLIVPAAIIALVLTLVGATLLAPAAAPDDDAGRTLASAIEERTGGTVQQVNTERSEVLVQLRSIDGCAEAPAVAADVLEAVAESDLAGWNVDLLLGEVRWDGASASALPRFEAAAAVCALDGASRFSLAADLVGLPADRDGILEEARTLLEPTGLRVVAETQIDVHERNRGRF